MLKSNRCRFAVAALCAMLVGSATLSAATVSKQSGAVLINKGNGFVPMPSQAELGPGNQVLVQPGGLASITYANNCVVRVGSGIWFVQSAAPCAAGTNEIDFTSRMNQQTDNTAPPGVPPVVVGGLVVAAGVGIAVLINNNKDKDSNKPASP